MFLQSEVKESALVAEISSVLTIQDRCVLFVIEAAAMDLINTEEPASGQCGREITI